MKLEEFLGKKKIDSEGLREVLSNIDKGKIKDYCRESLVDMKKFGEEHKNLLTEGQLKEFKIYEFANCDPKNLTEKEKLVLCVLALKVLYNKQIKKFRS